MSKKRKNSTVSLNNEDNNDIPTLTDDNSTPAAKRSKRNNKANERETIDRLITTIQTPIYNLLVAHETHLFHYTYYPQLKDQVAFLRDGYLAFVSNMEQLPDLNEYVKQYLVKKPPLNNGFNLPDVMLCEITKIKYSCCNVLAKGVAFTLRTIKFKVLEIPQHDAASGNHSNGNSGADESSDGGGGGLTDKQKKLIGTEFELDYIDHPSCMANYMVLRELYENSIDFLKKLKKNDSIHTSFDKSYHEGKVVEIGPKDESKPLSLWENVLVKWQDGESSDSRVSVWEIKEVGDETTVLAQIPKMSSDLTKKLEKAFLDFLNSELFFKVPLYKPSDPYPLLLAIVVDRLKSNFYRHLEHFESDVKHIVKTISKISTEGAKVLKKFGQEIGSIIGNTSGSLTSTTTTKASSSSTPSTTKANSQIKVKKTEAASSVSTLLDDDLTSSLLNLTSKQAKPKESLEKEVKTPKKEKEKGKEKRKEKTKEKTKEKGKEKEKEKGKEKEKKKKTETKKEAKKESRKETKKAETTKKETKKDGAKAEKQKKSPKKASKAKQSEPQPSDEPATSAGQLRRPILDVDNNERIINSISGFTGESVPKNILPSIPKIAKKNEQQKIDQSTKPESESQVDEPINFETDEVLYGESVLSTEKKRTAKKEPTEKQAKEKKAKPKTEKKVREKKSKKDKEQKQPADLKLKIKLTAPNATETEPASTTVISIPATSFSMLNDHREEEVDDFDGGFGSVDHEVPFVPPPSILEEQSQMITDEEEPQHVEEFGAPNVETVVPPVKVKFSMAPVTHAIPKESAPTIKRPHLNFSLNLKKKDLRMDIVDQHMEDVFELSDDSNQQVHPTEIVSNEDNLNEINVSLVTKSDSDMIQVDMTTNDDVDPIQQKQYQKWQQALVNWQQHNTASTKTSDYELREEPILSEQSPLYHSSVTLTTSVNRTPFINKEYYAPMRKMTNSTHSSNALYCFKFHKNLSNDTSVSAHNLILHSFCITLSTDENMMTDEHDEDLQQQLSISLSCTMNEPRRLKLHSLHYDVTEAVRLSSNPMLMFRHPHPERLARLRDRYGFLIADGFKWYADGFYFRARKNQTIAQTECSLIDIVCIHDTIEASFSLPTQSVPYTFRL